MSLTSDPGETEVPRWALSVLLGACQATAVTLIVVIGSPGVSSEDYGAFLFAAAFGALLLLRDPFPVAVLVLSIFGVFVYYAADYPPIGMAVPVVGAFFAAAERGRVGVAVVAGVVLLGVSLSFRSADGEPSAVLAYDLVTNVALIGCAVALALTVRSRRALREQHRQLMALQRRQQQAASARQVEAERLRVARDVHDSTGHALSVVAVQARVAQQSLGGDRAATAAALEHIVTATRTALADLRRTLTVLQAVPVGPDHSPLNLDGIERTAQAARDAGLDVDLVVDVGEVSIPAPTASTAFRIVQEAVTNVLRHAHAGRLRVVVRAKDGDLYLRVLDDGRGANTSAASRGRGITGMRERAALLGGDVSVTAGPTGFAVHARLPLADTP